MSSKRSEVKSDFSIMIGFFFMFNGMIRVEDFYSYEPQRESGVSCIGVKSNIVLVYQI